MPYRDVDFQAGHHYHLYNRGNNYQPIFFEPENYPTAPPLLPAVAGL